MERRKDGSCARSRCVRSTPNAPSVRGVRFLCSGSLFNHSDRPNVSYSIDTATVSIRYTTARAIEPDEELCIYYGSNLWFEPVETCSEPTCSDPQPVDDGWAGLSTIAGETPNHVPEETPDPNEILPDDDLPFTWVKLTSDEDDEETIETVRTGEHVPRFPTRLLMPNTKVQAWAVDIPDPRHTTTALKYIYPHPPSACSSTSCTNDRSLSF
jgi:tRNA-specific adenosine deaminase 3